MRTLRAPIAAHCGVVALFDALRIAPVERENHKHSDRLCLFTLRVHKRRPFRGKTPIAKSMPSHEMASIAETLVYGVSYTNNHWCTYREVVTL